LELKRLEQDRKRFEERHAVQTYEQSCQQQLKINEKEFERTLARQNQDHECRLALIRAQQEAESYMATETAKATARHAEAEINIKVVQAYKAAGLGDTAIAVIMQPNTGLELTIPPAYPPFMSGFMPNYNPILTRKRRRSF